jgi:hypothetical protein
MSSASADEMSGGSASSDAADRFPSKPINTADDRAAGGERAADGAAPGAGELNAGEPPEDVLAWALIESELAGCNDVVAVGCVEPCEVVEVFDESVEVAAYSFDELLS